jgi:uroporphyrinogen decarboxylase
MNTVPSEHQIHIKWLLAETERRNGLAPLDVERFWHDQQLARADPFGENIPQVPLGMLMSGECVYAELGLEEDFWRYEHDPSWRLELNKSYNNRSQEVVGRRLLSEEYSDPTWHWPATKTLADIFEAQQTWNTTSQSWWLHEAAHDEDALVALLDRVEARLENLRDFLLPENWDEEKERLQNRLAPPPRYRHQRGPVTFATSIYGCEKLIYLILDHPDLAARLRNTILHAMIGIAEVLDVEAGDTSETAPRGFSFADDNCALLTPEMYEFFGYPVLEAIFARFAPDANDRRYQHSDSAMAHLLPLLGKLKLTGANFGPTVQIQEIREHLPRATIEGQLAPYTLMRNEQENIVAEFLRDFEQAREKRGLLFATAGSINNGSLLTSMRLIMSAIQHFGRYGN